MKRIYMNVDAALCNVKSSINSLFVPEMHRSMTCGLPGSEATPTQQVATACPESLGAGVELSLGEKVTAIDA